MKNTVQLGAEVLSQMVTDEKIVGFMSEPLKKRISEIGIAAFLAITTAFSAGVAHASDKDRARNLTLGASTFMGILVDGAKPKDLPVECHNIQGMNGWKVGGAGAAGGIFGNQIGNGSGNTIATLGLGFVTSAAVASREQDRMIAECNNILRQNAERDAGYNRYNNSYNNGYNSGYNNAPQPVAYPTYNPNQKYNPINADILYETNDVNGRSLIVTTENSPGLSALKGQKVGSLSVESDPIVKRALDISSDGLAQSYEQLDNSAKVLLNYLRGGTSSQKISRYAVTDDDLRANESVRRSNQNEIRRAQAAYDASFVNYAQKRSMAANIYDNAAVDGYNITQYREVLNIMTPPESVVLVNGGKKVNKYGVIPR